jgi:hypothetical protein
MAEFEMFFLYGALLCRKSFPLFFTFVIIAVALLWFLSKQDVNIDS